MGKSSQLLERDLIPRGQQAGYIIYQKKKKKKKNKKNKKKKKKKIAVVESLDSRPKHPAKASCAS